MTCTHNWKWNDSLGEPDMQDTPLFNAPFTCLSCGAHAELCKTCHGAGTLDEDLGPTCPLCDGEEIVEMETTPEVRKQTLELAW